MGTTQSGILGGGCRLPSTKPISPTFMRHSTGTRRWSPRTAVISVMTALHDCLSPSIDIPLFIRQIATGNPIGSAKTIFRSEHTWWHVRPRLSHRKRSAKRPAYATRPRAAVGNRPPAALRDRIAMRRRTSNSIRAPRRSGRRVAVVGAGPAGLACAHRLAVKGHDVVIYDAREKSGASTNTASPPIRRSTTSPRKRSNTCFRSAASRSATARRSAATSPCRSGGRIRCRLSRPRSCRCQCTAIEG